MPISSLILASRSPQRRAILERLGVAFTVCATDVPELTHGDPAQVARENALRKARAALARDDAAAGETVLGCDTLVALGGRIYGKPADESAARVTLQALAGQTHEVVSGLALLTTPDAGAGVDTGAGADAGAGDCAGPGEGDRVGVRERTAVARTAVTFRELTEGMLDWYLARGEWRGRAGGYAIQGAGAALVTRVAGDYENVVGLPVATLVDLAPEILTGT